MDKDQKLKLIGYLSIEIDKLEQERENIKWDIDISKMCDDKKLYDILMDKRTILTDELIKKRQWRYKLVEELTDKKKEEKKRG